MLKHMDPTVFRFVDDCHIKQYLLHGELRLTSIARLRQVEDKNRFDVNEGNLSMTFCSKQFPPIAMTSDPDEPDYVLCTSLSPYAYNTKRYVSCLRIFDVEGLTRAVTDALERSGYEVRGVCIGPCTYAGRDDLCNVPEKAEMSAEHLHDLMKIGVGYAPFQKPWRFLMEHEFRIVWSLSYGLRVREPYITVKIDYPERYAQEMPLSKRFLGIITLMRRLEASILRLVQ